MRKKLVFGLWFCLLVIPCFLRGQEESGVLKKTFTRLSGDYKIGGTGDVYFFTYNGGLGFSAAQGYRISERFSLAGEISFEQLKDANLLPLTLAAEHHFGKKRKRFLKIHLGYAFGFTNGVYENYGVGGGLATGADYGFYLLKTENIRLLASFGYHFRRSGLKYRPFTGGAEIHDRLDNHFVSLRTGIEF